jgi:uncharacterized protein YdeI (BOF family)
MAVMGAPGPPPLPPGRPKMVACPACGASLTLRALGQSVSAACPSCGSLIDVSRPDVQLIRKYEGLARQLRLTLGTRGQLRGTLFQVIGAMQRHSEGASWEEYLLFNPYVGFRWLVYDEANWSLGRMIRDTSNVQPERGVPYQGQMFRRDNQAAAEVGWVVGEFYWRVATGERVMATDYVGSSAMLSREQSGDEITWTWLDTLRPGEVETAFHLPDAAQLSAAGSPGNPYWQRLCAIRRLAFYAVVAAFLLQILGVFMAHGKTIDVGSFDLHQRYASGAETQVFGPYELPSAHSAAAVIASAPLDNAWIQLRGSLVNTVSGKSFPFTDSLQYYHGDDSDGSWTEGSPTARALISEVPAGSYNLVVDGGSGDQNGQPLDAAVNLKLQLNAVTWQNFWLVTAAILSYPVYLLIRSIGALNWSVSRRSGA